ncbi:unnamed protein product [Menidia menidia]|uniref:(Atlantic silverside) hypothetical protein n=1 Tax=Menidia menidia TaxID=238744 RepID=A0A8S4AMV0_9TELE|nr:unnamed protein product [Menidia menidia]
MTRAGRQLHLQPSAPLTEWQSNAALWMKPCLIPSWMQSQTDTHTLRWTAPPPRAGPAPGKAHNASTKRSGSKALPGSASPRGPAHHRQEGRSPLKRLTTTGCQKEEWGGTTGGKLRSSSGRNVDLLACRCKTI